MAKAATIRPMKAPIDPVKPEHFAVSPANPVWVSPKLDGIRCLQMNSISKSSTLKDLPNKYMQACLAHPLLDGLDGELVVGSPTAPDVIQATTSGINSRGGEPDFKLYVFDRWDAPDDGFLARKAWVRSTYMKAKRLGLRVAFIPQILCTTQEELIQVVEQNYAAGYEGSMIRNYDGRYKYNRCTLNEGLILKVKEFVDSEAVITGFEEGTHNLNAAKLDERGLTKRSSHKANKVASGTLGRMIGKDLRSGQVITINPGKLTAPEKKHIWEHQEEFLGKISKYRYAPYGVKDLPRFPRHIVWRSPDDITV